MDKPSETSPGDIEKDPVQAVEVTPDAWPITPPFHRIVLGRTALVLAVGFLINAFLLFVFGKLANVILAKESIAIDLAVVNFWIHHSSPQLTSIAWYVSLLGSQVLGALAAGFALFFAIRRAWTSMLSILFTALGAQLLNDILKATFERPRPNPVEALVPAQVWSFPSGHAMVSTAFYALLAYLAWQVLSGWYRYAAVTGFVGIIVVVCVSRLILGVHYLTDVVAGTAVGLLWTETVIVSLAALSWGYRRRWPKVTTSSQSSG